MCIFIISIILPICHAFPVRFQEDEKNWILYFLEHGRAGEGSDEWSVEWGEWGVGSGEWRMESGEWRLVSEQWTMYRGQRTVSRRQ